MASLCCELRHSSASARWQLAHVSLPTKVIFSGGLSRETLKYAVIERQLRNSNDTPMIRIAATSPPRSRVLISTPGAQLRYASACPGFVFASHGRVSVAADPFCEIDVLCLPRPCGSGANWSGSAGGPVHPPQPVIARTALCSQAAFRQQRWPTQIG